MHEKKIVVFGGAGFIGRRMCDALANRGAAVTAFDKGSMEVNERLRCLQGDFFNESDVEAAIDGQDMIVHAICTIAPGTSVTHYMRGYEKDFVQTAKLCDMAFRQGKRLLFISSGGAIYASQTKPLKEDDPKAPINHYGSLKMCVEHMMQAFIHAGADFRIARVANAYGPGQDYRKGVGFIDAAIKKALQGEPIEVWGDGSIVRDYIHIDDICHMLCDVLAYDGGERVFNVGTGSGVSQQQIIEMVRGIFPKTEVRYLPARTIDVHHLVLDIDRYNHCFDYRPQMINQGLKDYVAWLIDHWLSH